MPARHSPVRLFAALVLLIFGIEEALMLALGFLLPHDASIWVQASVDACVVTVAASGFVWLFFIRPLRFALMREATRAKAVTESAAEGIIAMDQHGTIESFNPAAERMFGYRARQVIGKNVNILMAERYVGHDALFAAGKVGRTGSLREAIALRRDGTQFPIELNLTTFLLGGDRHFTALVRDITEHRQAQDRIEHLAYFDALTGIPNRVLFHDRLNQAINMARRDGDELALLYCDLDGFKAVNDTLGHQAGDEILKAAVGRIRHVMRGSDTLARVGGDEFTLILPSNASREAAANVAAKIMDAMSTPVPLGDRPDGICIGVSVGIATYPADAQDAAALVDAADAAMYQAKQAGKRRAAKRQLASQRIRGASAASSPTAPDSEAARRSLPSAIQMAMPEAA